MHEVNNFVCNVMLTIPLNVNVNTQGSHLLCLLVCSAKQRMDIFARNCSVPYLLYAIDLHNLHLLLYIVVGSCMCIIVVFHMLLCLPCLLFTVYLLPILFAQCFSLFCFAFVS